MKIRIKFARHGAVKFLGHLDMMRYFQKAVRRAEIDICYSNGFSPHQIMSFAMPLGVGVESNGEYFDIEVETMTTCQDIVDALNAQMAEGVTVLNAVVLPDNCGNAMASVAASTFTITFREGKLPCFNLKEACERIMALTELKIVKETKKSTMEIDIRPYIYELSGNEDSIFMMVDSSSANNVKPVMVVDALYDLYDQQKGEFDIMITRENTFQKSKKGKKKFVPLDEVN